MRYDKANDSVDPGFPRRTRDYWGNWPADFEPQAAVNWVVNDKVYFFSGDQYLRYDRSDDRVDPGFPKTTIDEWSNWPSRADFGAPQAAVNWGNGNVYFFSGTQYIKYKIGEGVAPGYPRETKNKWGTWPKPPNEALYIPQAAVRWNGKKAYFFGQGDYLFYRLKNIYATAGGVKTTLTNYLKQRDQCAADPHCNLQAQLGSGNGADVANILAAINAGETIDLEDFGQVGPQYGWHCGAGRPFDGQGWSEDENGNPEPLILDAIDYLCFRHDGNHWGASPGDFENHRGLYNAVQTLRGFETGNSTGALTRHFSDVKEAADIIEDWFGVIILAYDIYQAAQQIGEIVGNSIDDPVGAISLTSVDSPDPVTASFPSPTTQSADSPEPGAPLPANIQSTDETEEGTYEGPIPKTPLPPPASPPLRGALSKRDNNRPTNRCKNSQKRRRSPWLHEPREPLNN
ncbi:MAG: hypothetical protein GKR89_07765 [Candidatus Latescibacteria bacterium]|nr:hypothetical protein [Candidatus Latescibacterota bacterium]